MEGFPPAAMPAPQTVPSPAKLDGDGSSPRSITASQKVKHTGFPQAALAEPLLSLG